MEDEKRNLPAETSPQGQALSLSTGYQSIMDAATNPDVDANKMTALVDLQIKMMEFDFRVQERDSKAEFNRDKHAAIIAMPYIKKSGAIMNKAKQVQSRYSKYEDIDRVVRPILSANHLIITFDVDHEGQMVAVTPILSHTNGHVERGGKMLLPIDASGSKNPTQGVGSSTSYGKRQSMKAMLNIIEEGEDKDGKAGANEFNLSPEEQDTLDRGLAVTEHGIENYEQWFVALSNIQRGWLVKIGKHEEYKALAATNN